MTTSHDTHDQPEERVKLYLPSILGYEKIARGAAEALAEQIELAPDRIEDLKTAVAEACMNAIEHGNDLERAINVTVIMTISPDKLEVRVVDIGRHPMPDPLPTPGGGDSRGWGMFFIQNLVDEMEITRLPGGGNQIRMAIYLVRPSEDGADLPSNHSHSNHHAPDHPASES
jgi:serine/threonine-protein kinase RsbW